ncbi:hypothetical protein [Ktedonobacter racemifer]|uniref:Uncharacterized protein n=1 Tax=Ktedonobacter racemifer DSM 44963 TaxID=485913 RepID=D6U6M4_KTERA|nr:hypothetical protein [Ktedonobacter racemifer]EFH80635.1 hypothetical protein Krac_1250 [Ktedonobacter racemifer DSM 44963]
MIATQAYPIQDEHPQRPQENAPRGTYRTIRMLTQRVHDLMGVTFSGEDKYVVIACSETITATLALNFQTTFQTERPIQAVLVSYGKANPSGDGYIIIRWRGIVPESFFDQLDQFTREIAYYMTFSAGPLDICRAPWDGTTNA